MSSLWAVGVPAAAALGAAAYLLYCWRQNRDLPPGPCGLPVLGRLPWLDPRNMHLDMLRECRRYGDLCSFYVGSRLFVVVNSHTLLKEMLEDPVFAGRPQMRVVNKVTRGCGIIFAEGELWSQQRRLSLRTLREFGFARAQTVDMIDDQLDGIFQTFDGASAAEEPLKVLDSFLVASNSIITEMTLGHRFDRDNPEFKKVNDIIRGLLEQGFAETFSVLFPVVERFVEMVPMASKQVRDVEYLHGFIRNEIRQRERIMTSEAAEPQCLCDVYIQERRKAEILGDTETFKEFQIIRVCFEFYIAGTDTTARSIEWLLLYMAFYPSVQDRLQRELDEVVGQSRRPRMQDKTRLHYTMAVIDECYRKVSLAAVGLFHRAVQDTTFHGYRIPSNAFIMPLIYGIHHKPGSWEKPDEFYPEHFLDDDGRYRSNPGLIPFLIGRRSCVGESLARMEVVLFFTAIMQRYRLLPDPGSLARRDQILAGFLGSLRVPGDYRLIVSRRLP